ncbi:teichuronic acid exporter [Chryseobacterium sp. SORGH_AS 447]|uniref:lipopolysaccharide biosynthesis protein n=1 Tax=Chryseobacterium sp. SORGH_AS_0447 TaxID=3041769 RepID=UPI002786E77D|nr:lipopolysaccharide biosynthesis protein [Chryseobacterium sp. SORGH_AS_0447]MDQ1161010.1 teichuronic acid exporter [Chryseobacterium sp. SORGH_AS_0447]
MSLKEQAIKGAIWTYIQQFGTQIVNFVVSIFLARMLIPEEFGLIGMIAIFMGIGNTLFDGGMTSSLIRSDNLENSDYSTVFIFNLVVSIGVYCIVFFSAPLIAEFYKQPSLTKITRFYCLSFIFSSFGSVQNTMLTKTMNFKKQALLSVPAIVLGSTVALVMAKQGYGVWSLVGLTLVNTFVLSCFLWITSSWKPTLVFSLVKFKKHFKYGYKLTLSGILDIVFTNIYQIVIGRFFTPTTVGYYTRANQLMMMPIGNISTALNKVAFPIFAQLQNDEMRLRDAYKRIMLLVLYIINPITVLMLVLAEPITVLLFTKKWLPMVPIFQVICLSGLLYPLHLYNLLILQVKGRSDLFLRLEIIKKVLLTIIIIISFYYGLYGLLWGQLFFSIIALFINTYFAGKMIGYSTQNQLLDMLPLYILITFVGSTIYLIDTYIFNNFTDIIRLALSLVSGLTLYVGLSYLFKVSCLSELKNIVLRK